MLMTSYIMYQFYIWWAIFKIINEVQLGLQVNQTITVDPYKQKLNLLDRFQPILPYQISWNPISSFGDETYRQTNRQSITHDFPTRCVHFGQRMHGMEIKHETFCRQWNPYLINYGRNALSYTKLRFSLNGSYAKLHQESESWSNNFSIQVDKLFLHK
jgi:hypothetical protein